MILCWQIFTAHFPANQCSLMSSACSLPIWERMQLITLRYGVTSINLPGTSTDTIDKGLAELLHSTSFSQFVTSPTRHDSHHACMTGHQSLLDLTITPSLSKLVPLTYNVSYHEISDHDLTLTNLSTKRYKSPPQRTYHYRNIKGIDVDLFEQTILYHPRFFSSPDPIVTSMASPIRWKLN